MRVIGGQYRSRLLAAVRGMETRPTSDRLRETLFNILAPRIEGSRVLDLYAGTGAVGIEALSRGAARVTFVENAKPAISVIRANLASLKVTTNFSIEPRSAAAAIERFSKSAAKFDIIFLDPPYEAEHEYEKTLTALGKGMLLAEGALIIAEHRSRDSLAEHYGLLKRTRVLKQGDAGLSFFTVS
jgi:16S rRNA (guanine(966)-N(2))-methyltransferase RsmD